MATGIHEELILIDEAGSKPRSCQDRRSSCSSGAKSNINFRCQQRSWSTESWDVHGRKNRREVRSPQRFHKTFTSLFPFPAKTPSSKLWWLSFKGRPRLFLTTPVAMATFQCPKVGCRSRDGPLFAFPQHRGEYLLWMEGERQTSARWDAWQPPPPDPPTTVAISYRERCAEGSNLLPELAQCLTRADISMLKWQ